SHVDLVNGFANRFWWFAVRRVQSRPFGGMPTGLASLTPRLEQAIVDAGGIGRLAWTDPARSLWAGSIYDELTTPVLGRLAEVLSRSAPHVLRVAGIYALADGKQALEPDHLLAAKALWDSSAKCACYIFGDALGDPIAEKILHAL